MRFIAYLIFCLVSCGLFADDEVFECKRLDNFISYKKARQFEKENNMKKAMSYFCNLAFSGDYRSQFKLSTYYKSGISPFLKQDKVLALLWGKMSTYSIKSKKRARLITSLEKDMSSSEINKANILFSELIKHISTDKRIDMKYKPLDFDKILEKKTYTGSRIKRKEPPSKVEIYR